MQPPPNYPQQNQPQHGGQYQGGQQQYPPQQYPQQQYPAHGPQQYGGYQQPYYQPQKKGMPVWGWILIAVVVVFFVLPFMAGVGMALFGAGMGGNTRDAQRAEGEQLMGSARDYLRVQYSKSGDGLRATQEFSMQAAQGSFDGLYYTVDPFPYLTEGQQFDCEIRAHPTPEADDFATGTMRFRWASGESKIDWK